jgi:hypothetical protein
MGVGGRTCSGAKRMARSTLPKQLNGQENKLAKYSLLSAIAGGSVMDGDFPFEVVKFKLLGKPVSR